MADAVTMCVTWCGALHDSGCAAWGWFNRAAAAAECVQRMLSEQCRFDLAYFIASRHRCSVCALRLHKWVVLSR
jgi:hypothetical protein